MSSVVIAPATFQDLPACRDLFRQMIHERPYVYPVIDGDELDAFVRMMAIQLQHGYPLFVTFMAAREGQAVGMLGVEIGERAVGRPHRVINVHWIYVHPTGRKQGVAAALIAYGTEWLHRVHPDVTHVEFFSAANDPQWLHRGFRPFLVRYRATVEQVEAFKPILPNGKDEDPPLVLEEHQDP